MIPHFIRHNIFYKLDKKYANFKKNQTHKKNYKHVPHSQEFL